MDTRVIDIGCSQVKEIWFNENVMAVPKRLPTQLHTMSDIDVLVEKLQETADDATTIVTSYSDSVIVEMKDGELRHVFPKPTNTLVFPVDLPRYQESGKPRNSELAGIGLSLINYQRQYGLDPIHRILPVSTYIAARLAADKEWNTWDITHASNSGMWDYTTGQWHARMEDFIDRAIINAEVVKPNREVGNNILIGGHDQVFANANDTPYSSKPYLSVGTWVTASVEAHLAPKDNASPARFVVAPNGTILEQLCINVSAKGHDACYELTTEFFEKRMTEKVHHPEIRLFGGWADEAYGIWAKHPTLRFKNMGKHFQHEQTAKYAQNAALAFTYPPSSTESAYGDQLGNV